MRAIYVMASRLLECGVFFGQVKFLVRRLSLPLGRCAVEKSGNVRGSAL
jgi:hypothetical protein